MGIETKCAEEIALIHVRHSDSIAQSVFVKHWCHQITEFRLIPGFLPSLDSNFVFEVDYTEPTADGTVYFMKCLFGKYEAR